MNSGYRGMTVPNVCLQALTLSLLPRDFSPFPQTESLFTGYYFIRWYMGIFLEELSYSHY